MTDQTCSRCGSPIVAGAHFCSRCGHDVSGEQAVLATAKMAAPPPPPAPPSHPPSEILEPLRRATTGDYDVAGELGRGGMATVFLAHDIALDRKVAIKVMTPSLVTGPGMVERFKREARTAASLSHPHIIPIYAVRETDRLLFFVMKYVEGRSLDTIIREVGALPIPIVQAIMAQVGGALGYAHRRGIVHRDIKPANVMIDEEGWAVVTDFGIAKVADARGLTMTGVTIGTPTYMSPEQCASKEITGATDQYSLGIVAFELLTGRIPFDADSLMGIMWKHFNEPPPPIRELRPDCPEPVADAITRMLAKSPNDRWPTLEDAIAAVGQPPMAPGDPIRHQMRELGQGGTGAGLREAVHTPASPIPAGASPDAPTTPSGIAPLPSGPAAAPPSREMVEQHVTEAPTVVTDDGPTILTGDAATLVTRDAPAAPVTRPTPSRLAPTRPLPSGGVAPPEEAPRRRGLVYALGLTGLAAASAAAVWVVLSLRSSAAPSGTRPDTVVVAPPAGPPPAPVAQVTLTPESQSMAVGATADLHAFLLDSASNPLSNRTIDWRSTDSGIATVHAGMGISGVVQGVKAGTVRIIAIAEGKADTASVTVTAVRASVASVAVQLQTTDLAPGDTAPVALLVHDAKGGNLGGRTVQLESSNPQVVRVLGSQLVALAEGTSSITAISEGVRSSAMRVVVKTPPVQSVAVSGPRALDQGGSAKLGVAVRDARGRPVTGRPVAWRSSNPRAITVSADGVVQAVGEGQASITAEVAGVSGQVAITARPPARVAIEEIRLSRPLTALEVGGSASASASVLGPGGQTLMDRTLSWRSSDPAVASVDQNGTITARSAGTVTITAASEGKSQSFQLTVSAPAAPVTTVEPVTPPAPTPAAPAMTVAAIAAGAEATCVTLSDGAATCWGGGAPTPPAGTTFQRIVSGSAHACGLTGDGTAECWGTNASGQLGTGQTSRDVVARPARVATDRKFKALAAGGAHSCGLATDGTAWCWGENGNGQLGNGSTRDQATPVQVSGGIAFTALTAGDKHTCGVDANGIAYCWGDGFSYQLGLGAQVERDEPDKVGVREPIQTIAAGKESTCATGREGTTYCWGKGGSPFGTSPRKVETDQRFSQLAVGDEFACGLTQAGAAWCWGRNNRGQLGDGSGKDQRVPVRVATSEPLTTIAAGNTHVCAVARSGPTLCWGDNAKGQVGAGAAEPVKTPVPVEIRR